MKKTIFILTTLITSFTLFSCASVKEIPENKTAAQILQLGQNAATVGSYSGAEYCFKEAIIRFGEADLPTYVEATYELGHIYSKQKKYDIALDCFREVLVKYEENMYNPQVALDPAYKKLCEIGIENIENKLNKAKK